MKRLFGGAAVLAALVVAAPVWAQPNSSAGNPVGLPGPNPGGPGLTPYSGGAPTAPVGRGFGPKTSGSNYIPPGGAAAPPPGAEAPPASANSAMPPMGHHHRMYKHAKAMRNFHRRMAQKAELRGDTTAALNREELARIQSGNMSNPPAPPAPPPMPAK